MAETWRRSPIHWEIPQTATAIVPFAGFGQSGTLAATGLPASVSGNTFNADNGMIAFNGTTLSYDANGNLTSDGTNTYTWDARNHLAAIGGAVTASFTYDGFGRRASKTIAGVSTQFLYDVLNPVQEQNSSTGVANLLTGLGIDEYFTRKDSSNNVSTFLQDALGSTIGLVGSAQSIATTYTYEPFGAATVGGAANGNTFEFTGRENDGTTGLYFHRARYYSPSFQRFAAQDPIGFRGGSSNLYEYVRNDPIDKVDRLGLWGPECEQIGQEIKDLSAQQRSCSNPVESQKISNQLAQLQALWDLYGCDEGPPPDGDGGDEVPGEVDSGFKKAAAQAAGGVGLGALLWEIFGPVVAFP